MHIRTPFPYSQSVSHTALGCTALLFALLIILAGHARGEEPNAPTPPKRTLLIAPFENQTATKCPVEYEVMTGSEPGQPKRTLTVDRYSEAPRAILENAFSTNPGVILIERQRVDAMLLENNFGSFSGLVDASSANALGRMLGAQVLVMGTILRIDAQDRAFHGYGVETRTTIVTAQIRIRSLDIATGTIVASTIAEGSKSYSLSQFGGVADRDVAFAVVDIALHKVIDDPVLFASLTGSPQMHGAATVSIRVEPQPAGCDVLVNGTYRGSSPLKLDIPTHGMVKIRLEKAGYEAWERQIDPSLAPTVAPTLTEGR